MFHSRHIQEDQYSIEYICRVLNTLYDNLVYLQREVRVEELDPSRPSLIEYLDHLSRNTTSDKVALQLERFHLKFKQFEEISSTLGKLEAKLDYLKEKQYLLDIEKKLVHTEHLADNIRQQAIELKSS